jgi:L-ascorbate metabolism protein UlaG (beta-lactamase superfamily)
MQITHYGHSCLLVEAGGTRVLVDPGTFSHGFEELTGLAAVLVTHQHPDHVDVERLPALLEANDEARLLVEPELAAELGKAGIEAQPLHAGESATLGDLSVRALGGLHAVIHPDVPRVGNVGLLLSDGSQTLFHPGDAIDVVPGPDDAPDGVDVLAVPVAAPWSALKETVEYLRAVAPRRAFGIHEAILSGPGQAVYARMLGMLAPEGTTWSDTP